MSSLAPIVLFVYNRPWHTLQTLEALTRNSLAKDSVLYIYADGIKDGADEKSIQGLNETRKVIKEKQWCGEVNIIESERNKGLARSIVEGVTHVINKHGKIIVLEDDIATTPHFLEYMNEALSLYEKEERVMHISGFTPYTTGAENLPETFFLRFMSCWGWGTWKSAWDNFIPDIDYLYNTIPQRKDFAEYNLSGTVDMFSQIEANKNGALKTWAIKWYSTIFLNEGLCLYPQQSLVKNMGFDGSGENCYYNKDRYDIATDRAIEVQPIAIEKNNPAYNYLIRFYKYGNDSSFRIRLYHYLNQSPILSNILKLKRFLKL